MSRLSSHIRFFIRQSLNRRLIAALHLACLALLVSGFASVAWGVEVPDYQGYVNDYAGMMSPGTRAKLERVLSSFDLSDSTQVAILTIDSLQGDPIADFSIRVVDKWKIGRKGKDNGVLFLVVKNDHKMRIEVGRGLEPVLTDLVSGRIIANVVAPRFKEGRYDEGFEAGINAIIQTTRGQFTAETRSRGLGNGQPPPLFKYLLFGAFFLFYLSLTSRTLGVIGGSVLLPLVFLLGLPGPIKWILILMLIPAGGLAGLILSFLFAESAKYRGPGGGGFYTGGSGFGGFGGGGFGGGGFGGFGGGGFGGGGASGGW